MCTCTASSLPLHCPRCTRFPPIASTDCILSALAANSASNAWCFWCLDWMLAGSYGKSDIRTNGLFEKYKNLLKRGIMRFNLAKLYFKYNKMFLDMTLTDCLFVMLTRIGQGNTVLLSIFLMI